MNTKGMGLVPFEPKGTKRYEDKWESVSHRSQGSRGEINRSNAGHTGFVQSLRFWGPSNLFHPGC